MKTAERRIFTAECAEHAEKIQFGLDRIYRIES